MVFPVSEGTPTLKLYPGTSGSPNLSELVYPKAKPIFRNFWLLIICSVVSKYWGVNSIRIDLKPDEIILIG